MVQGDSQQANDVPITKRDLKFALEEVDLADWHPDGAHTSHFLNALSIFFPEGESFFIDAVLHYKDRIQSDELRSDVKGFGGQEAMHSREHRRYNRALVEAGYPVKELEGIVVRLLDVVRKLPPSMQLAATIALEHYTAILADVLLTHDQTLDGADPRMAALWRWHAIEETEHKAVAYDVWQEVRGPGPLAYAERSVAMLIATALFWPMVFAFHFELVRRSKAATDVRGWGRYFRLLFYSPGILTRIALPWLSYFKPSFHPWQQDNRDHVEAWKSAYEAAGMVP